jgi:hypothetical protein
MYCSLAPVVLCQKGSILAPPVSVPGIRDCHLPEQAQASSLSAPAARPLSIEDIHVAMPMHLVETSILTVRGSLMSLPTG